MATRRTPATAAAKKNRKGDDGAIIMMYGNFRGIVDINYAVDTIDVCCRQEKNFMMTATESLFRVSFLFGCKSVCLWETFPPEMMNNDNRICR